MAAEETRLTHEEHGTQIMPERIQLVNQYHATPQTWDITGTRRDSMSPDLPGWSFVGTGTHLMSPSIPPQCVTGQEATWEGFTKNTSSSAQIRAVSPVTNHDLENFLYFWQQQQQQQQQQLKNLMQHSTVINPERRDTCTVKIEVDNKATQFPETEEVQLPTAADFRLGTPWPDYTHERLEETIIRFFPNCKTERDVGPPNAKLTARTLEALMIPVTLDIRKALWWELRKAKRRILERGPHRGQKRKRD